MSLPDYLIDQNALKQMIINYYYVPRGLTIKDSINAELTVNGRKIPTDLGHFSIKKSDVFTLRISQSDVDRLAMIESLSIEAREIKLSDYEVWTYEQLVEVRDQIDHYQLVDRSRSMYNTEVMFTLKDGRRFKTTVKRVIVNGKAILRPP